MNPEDINSCGEALEKAKEMNRRHLLELSQLMERQEAEWDEFNRGLNGQITRKHKSLE